MLKIYGHPMSTCTRKVLTTVDELGLPHEFVMVDITKGEQKQPAHLARQPFGHVPSIDDDGFTMYESRAICRYLNEKAHGPLVPTDVRARAKLEQWISIETSEFTGAAMKFIYHHIFKNLQDEASLATARTAMERTLGVMEAELARQSYLVGETFSLAEIAFMPYVDYTQASPAKEIYAAFPKVGAWWSRVSARPSWRKVSGRG